MKLFECQNCGQPLYFENTKCESCGARLGYLPREQTVTALRPAGDEWQALARRNVRYRFCQNAVHEACNWLIPADEPDQFCIACRHNRTIPDLSQPENLRRWRLIEAAKHRLFYTLLKLRLPLDAKNKDANPLTFDFLDPGAAVAGAPVMTGHDNGLITLNVAEADDAERERVRGNLGELYRTLLGHFRHEIAHYYWDRLIADSPNLEAFRELFGDERRDYGQALQAYYANGAPAGLGQQLHLRLCVIPSVGGFRRDLGALFSHGRHARNRECVRARGQSEIVKGHGDAHRFRSASCRARPHRRRLAAAHLRGQLDQSQHGRARPLSVCAEPAGDRQARIHS